MFEQVLLASRGAIVDVALAVCCMMAKHRIELQSFLSLLYSFPSQIGWYMFQSWMG